MLEKDVKIQNTSDRGPRYNIREALLPRDSELRDFSRFSRSLEMHPSYKQEGLPFMQ